MAVTAGHGPRPERARSRLSPVKRAPLAPSAPPSYRGGVGVAGPVGGGSKSLLCRAKLLSVSHGRNKRNGSPYGARTAAGQRCAPTGTHHDR